jgi:hypothetical protein
MNHKTTQAQTSELLSALADGQLRDDEVAGLLRACRQEGGAAYANWNTYHLIGDGPRRRPRKGQRRTFWSGSANAWRRNLPVNQRQWHLSGCSMNPLFKVFRHAVMLRMMKPFAGSSLLALHPSRLLPPLPGTPRASPLRLARRNSRKGRRSSRWLSWHPRKDRLSGTPDLRNCSLRIGSLAACPPCRRHRDFCRMPLLIPLRVQGARRRLHAETSAHHEI